MKKNLLRTILCVALATALVFALAVPAYADGGTLVVTKGLENRTCTAGETISLSVAASYSNLAAGEVPGEITYTWYSQASQSLAVSGSTVNAVVNGNDVISCTISGSINGVATAPITVSCNITVTNTVPSPNPTTPVSGTVSKPTITQQPVGANLLPGQTATLSVGATCPNLGNGVSLVYQWFYSTKSNGANAVQISNSNSSSFTTPAVNSTYYYFVGIVATNGTQTSEAVYSNIVAVTYNNGQLKITKNPTGETVDAGGSALFVARADNASSFVWRIVSKDTTQTINAKDAAGYFRGLSVSGTDSDTLVLSNIPASMDGWSVECKFIGSDGKTFVCTNGAVIRVNGASSSTGSGSGNTTSPSPSGYVPGASASPKPSASSAPNTGDNSVDAPSISNQPVGAVLSEGETTTLSVTATPAAADSNVTIKYQWYRNDTNSNANGTAIGGAQSESYKPDTISGTKYYYVGVWSTDGTHTSKVVYSSPVAVTYTAPATSASPTPTDNANDKDEADGVSSISILWPVIAMIVAAAAIGVGVFFLLKKGGSKKNSRDYSEYDDDSYNDDNYRR